MKFPWCHIPSFENMQLYTKSENRMTLYTKHVWSHQGESQCLHNDACFTSTSIRSSKICKEQGLCSSNGVNK
jgi:hypothetical protein